MKSHFSEWIHCQNIDDIADGWMREFNISFAQAHAYQTWDPTQQISCVMIDSAAWLSSTLVIFLHEN